MLLTACALAAAGCELFVSALGGYTGPPPNTTDIAAETVIVRTVSEQPRTGILFFYVDRLRLLKTRPHDINRVVEAMSVDIHPEVTRLGLAAGDTILISTRYVGAREAGALSPAVPDWPFDKYDEYTLGLHALTSVERLGP
jgi:hypothetical protein